MNDGKRVTETTLHGDVTYEVVECDSCGMEAVKDECVEFTIGDTNGWACGFCAEAGPAGMPTLVDRVSLPFAAFCAALWPLIVGVHLLDYDDMEPREREMLKYALALIVGAVMWVSAMWLLVFSALSNSAGSAMPLLVGWA